MPRLPNVERNRRICRHAQDGWTVKRIAQSEAISLERVRQILWRAGYSFVSGWQRTEPSTNLRQASQGERDA